MTRDQILKVCRLYKEKLEKRNNNEIKGHRHILHMLDEIQRMVIIQTELDKAYRWLGFVQGVLWAEQVYTIDEMRKHNKSN